MFLPRFRDSICKNDLIRLFLSSLSASLFPLFSSSSLSDSSAPSSSSLTTHCPIVSENIFLIVSCLGTLLFRSTAGVSNKLSAGRKYLASAIFHERVNPPTGSLLILIVLVSSRNMLISGQELVPGIPSLLNSEF